MSGRRGPKGGMEHGPGKGQWPVEIKPKMRAVRRGVGLTLARAFREGA